MAQRGADDATGRVEGGAGAYGVDVAEQAHQRELEVAVGVAEHLGAGVEVAAAGLGQDARPSGRCSFAFLATTPVIRLE